jgi:hypothetical protein
MRTLTTVTIAQHLVLSFRSAPEFSAGSYFGSVTLFDRSASCFFKANNDSDALAYLKQQALKLVL